MAAGVGVTLGLGSAGNPMTNKMKIELPIATVSESNRRDHWRVKAKRVRLQRRTAAMLVPGCPLPCVVTLTRISPRMLDDDNLQSALKAVRDGVADRLGIDDRDPRVEWRYDQRKGAQSVEVMFEEAE